jgi:hypothetical protein
VVLLNYAVLLTRDAWFAPGVIGLLLLQPMRWRRLCIVLLFIPLVMLARTTGLASALGIYYMSPLLPLVAIGVASLVWKGTGFVARMSQRDFTDLLYAWGWSDKPFWRTWVQRRWVAIGASLFILLIIISPFMMGVFWTMRSIQGAYETPIDPVLVDVQEARQALDFINAHIQPDDLVIASPALAWGINANAADFQQSLASQGIATQHFPADIPADRFAFDPDYRRARYVVIDRIWRNWAALNMPEVADIMAVVEGWPLEFSAGEIQVYRNPNIH